MRNTKAITATKAVLTTMTAVLLFVLLICGIFCVNGTAYAADSLRKQKNM